MKKLILITGMFLCAYAGFAQSAVTVDKNSPTETFGNSVEITAAAIPFDQKDNFKIDTENYHKEVIIQDNFFENNNSVEITVEAKKFGDQNNASVKKEAINVNSSKAIISSKTVQKEVEIKAAAIKK